MNAAYEKLIEHLDEHQYQYSADAKHQSAFADFRGEFGRYSTWIQVTEEADLFQVFGLVPVRIPAGAHAAIAELITRANCGMQVGKFEMNYEEREVRFQAAQILTSFTLESDVIDRLIQATITMLDAYLPAILSVVYGNELPINAAKRVELDLGDCSREEPPAPPEDLPF